MHGIIINDVRIQFPCFCHLKAWPILHHGCKQTRWKYFRWRLVSPMGRVRGLLQALDRIRDQQTPPPPGRGPGHPQMGRGRGFPPPSPPWVGCGRARTRILLVEMTAQNSAQPPSPVFYPLGRGNGLRSSPPHPGNRARARPLPPTPILRPLALGDPGVEPLGTLTAQSPHIFQIQFPYVYVLREVSLTPSYESIMNLPLGSPLRSPSSHTNLLPMTLTLLP